MEELGNFKVDLETQHPNPNDPTKVRKGDTPRVAFTKVNDLIDSLVQGVEYIGLNAPLETAPFMRWLDISKTPFELYRRNSTNTQWVLESTVNDSVSPYTGVLRLRGVLPAGTNLNTFTGRDKVGIWSVTSSSNATVALGFPADNLGAGEVIILPAATGIIQIFRHYNTGDESYRGTPDSGNIRTTWRTTVYRDMLGTAAQHNTVVDRMDTTAGRVLNVGYMGIGAANNPAINLRDQNQPAGFYGGRGAQEPRENIPWGSSGFYGSAIVARRGEASSGFNAFLMDGWLAGHVSYNFNDNIWHMVEYLTTGNCTVVENANGRSIRFPFGLQICTVSKSVAVELTLADGALFRTDAPLVWTYPQQFVRRTYADAKPDAQSTGEQRIWVAPTSSGQGMASTAFRVMSPSSSSRTVSFNFFAIGWWK